MLPVHQKMPVFFSIVIQLELWSTCCKLLCQHPWGKQSTENVITTANPYVSHFNHSGAVLLALSAFLNSNCLGVQVTRICLFLDMHCQCLPTDEEKSMTEFSMISKRRCETLPASRVEPIFLFLLVACRRVYFTVHQSPSAMKKPPGSAWPLKLPMTPELWEAQIYLYEEDKDLY